MVIDSESDFDDDILLAYIYLNIRKKRKRFSVDGKRGERITPCSKK